MITDENPRIHEGEMYQLIRSDEFDEFNRRREKGESVDLRGVDLRSQDLRRFNLQDLDLSNCYMRQADLRGLNLQSCNLEGASIHGASISGTYFPVELSATELRLSREFGIRMRYGC